MVAAWKEEGSRGLAHVAMEDFPTVADAIYEIADNPLDYRRGRPLEIDITIDKDRDRIIVEDRGGEGMDADGIADWLQWGTGHPHAADDIGKYHKGGKAACGYLAQSVVILTRRAGQHEVWRLEDLRWKSRPEWADYGDPTPYTGPVPAHLSELPREVGFTRIELANLEDRRYNVDRLRWMIGNTYRRLIGNGAVQFRLNGDPVLALELPLSSAFKTVRGTVPTRRGPVKYWVGRLDRDAVKGGPHRIQGGMRLLFQLRLISEGEYFGHHAEGKGLLASLIGEVELNHLEPLSNKTGFKQGTEDWAQVEEKLNKELAPIIAAFRRAAEEHPVSREERKRVSLVRRQLAEALAQLDVGSDRPDRVDLARDGRRPPQANSTVTPTSRTPAHRRSQHPRTEAPADAVGVLQRLRQRLRAGTHVPPIELADLDPSVRSEAIRVGDGISKIVVNRAYPLYRQLEGREAYLAETAVMEMLMPAEAERTTVPVYVGQVNQYIEAWARVAEAPPAAGTSRTPRTRPVSA